MLSLYYFDVYEVDVFIVYYHEISLTFMNIHLNLSDICAFDIDACLTVSQDRVHPYPHHGQA